MIFDNKIILVTGGSKGIGYTVAQEFLKEGAIVYINSRNIINLKKAKKKLQLISKNIKCLVGDLSKEKIVKKVFSEIIKDHQRIDIVVNCAGYSEAKKHENISLKDWYNMIDNNVTNTFLVSKEAIKFMKRKRYGKIVNVSSVAGRNRSKLAGVHYSLSKSAIITLTRQMGSEVAAFGININCIAPSQTETEMLKPFLNKKNKKNLISTIPIGRLAKTIDQARVILFLSSGQSDYMVGSIVDVNGGQV